MTTLDHKSMEVRGWSSGVGVVHHYKLQWFGHVRRMGKNRFPKIILALIFNMNVEKVSLDPPRYLGGIPNAADSPVVGYTRGCTHINVGLGPQKLYICHYSVNLSFSKCNPMNILSFERGYVFKMKVSSWILWL